jgi:hypothetical protein
MHLGVGRTQDLDVVDLELVRLSGALGGDPGPGETDGSPDGETA